MEEKKLPHDHGQSMERELEQLEGTVEDIIYQNEDNGYVVFEMEEIVLWQRRFLSLMMKSLL